jgi:Cys-tRNA(Pro)/Cys-tRNA(Cys) deacylase
MTPAINAARKAKINFTLHRYSHNPSADSYGEEAAIALGVPAERVFKTLVTSLDGKKDLLAVAIVPVSRRLNLKALASFYGVKKVSMAYGKDAERATGYVIGGISPLGGRKQLPMVLDESALKYRSIYVSAGKRGLQIELSPIDLLRITGAKTGAIGR